MRLKEAKVKKVWKVTSLILLMVLLAGAGCKPTTTQVIPTSTQSEVVEPTATPAPAEQTSTDWWRTATFYEIFVRSFNDSNGDGIGDFNGITAKLDYLNDGDPNAKTDLGINAIWLMPINPSPSYHGYDVTDYMAVNPQYGTLDDFRNLLAEAHKRGIHVIIDWVINHTSSEHPWFQAAQDPNSPYRDYYIWSDSNPNYAGPWGEIVWYPGKVGYYYGIFWSGMPDLNYRTPAVTDEIEKAANFWLKDVGIDGFRVDAAMYLIEDGKVQANTPETHDWYKRFRTFYKGINPNAMTVGEVWTTTSTVATYLQGDQLDLAFNFDMADAWVTGVSGYDASVLKFIIKYEYDRTKNTQFATFLTNHDQNRVLSTLNKDIAKAKTAATLLLTFPGVPFIYYGEEIGMLGTKPDEDIRRPMQWTAEANAGFTTGSPWRAPDASYTTFNVAAEEADTNSLLNHYRTLIQLRMAHPALQNGTLTPVDSPNLKTIAYLREDDQNSYLIIANLGNMAAVNIALSAPSSRLTKPVNPWMVIGEGSPAGLTVDANGGFANYEPLPEIPAMTAIVIQLR